MAKIEAKTAYLDKVSREVPEYAEVLVLFRELYSLIASRNGETGISFAPSLQGITGKIDTGIPVLSAEDMSINPERAISFFTGIIDVMITVGKDAGEPLARFRELLQKGELNLTHLVAGCLGRDRGVIQETAVATDLPAPLLEFILEVGLRTALEQVADSIEPSLVAGWQGGTCPICGSRPGMAELVGDEGRRQLSCSACAFTWPAARITCPFCGNDDPDKLSYLEVGDGPVRVDLCTGCSRYIKTRDSRKGNAGVPLDAEDLVTLHLDILAGRQGYERGK